jgi:hypothetical protein
MSWASALVLLLLLSLFLFPLLLLLLLVLPRLLLLLPSTAAFRDAFFCVEEAECVPAADVFPPPPPFAIAAPGRSSCPSVWR